MADSTSSSFPGVTLACEKLERFLGEGENRILILRQVDLELSRGCISQLLGLRVVERAPCCIRSVCLIERMQERSGLMVPR